MKGANTRQPPQLVHPATGIVVEDMPATREWLAQALQQAFPGINTHTAATVEQARTWLAGLASRHHQASVLALIDLRLPDGSGLDIVRLCDRQGIVPVVTSIYDDDASLFEALEAGAQGYLLKDHPMPQLVHYLHRIGQGEPPLSPSIARRILASLRGQSDDAAPATGDSQGLTPREAEVLRHIGQGLRVSEVAHALGLTEHTVAGYIKNIYRKLNISSRAQAALEAARRQLL